MSSWILFGLITGIVVHAIYPYRDKGGIFGALLVGGFGAVLGSILAGT